MILVDFIVIVPACGLSAVDSVIVIGPAFVPFCRLSLVDSVIVNIPALVSFCGLSVVDSVIVIVSVGQVKLIVLDG